LGTVWFDALRDGLAAARRRTVAVALSPSDLRVAYFGDLFRPPGAMAPQDPRYDAAEVAAGWERELLAELYRAAVTQDASLGPPGGALDAGHTAVRVMLHQLLRSTTFAGIAQRALIGNLKQVGRFLHDAQVKDRVLTRVGAAISAETRVMIGHSLGSVVAYEYLCRYRPRSVQLLVTLGSPLGIPNLIFERLSPAPVGGRGWWPGSIASWVNIADRDDIVALRTTLSGLFPPPAGVAPVQDRPVDNGGRPHAIDRYLNAGPTGEALGAVLG
jgi:hypothetical protein